MLDVLGLAQKDKDAINESYRALQKKFECEIDNDLSNALASRITELQLLEPYHTVSIKNVFKIHDKGKEFYILSIYLTEVDLKFDFTVLMFGMLILKDHYDPILIQPKTMWDSLMKIFGIGKGHMEGFQGSKNKYSISTKGSKQVPQAFLNELSDMEKIHIEFDENTLLATLNRPINTSDTLSLAEFLSRVAPILS